ncbi:MAG TPA: helix-turn-helix domain-containing protein [Kutzneria sp.]|jgi:AcrR family transcriptional regulator
METEIVSSVSSADRILAAASRLFLGPGRVSMDELARELGMSKKTIYRHFPDREALLSAVLDRQFGAIERAVLAAEQETRGRSYAERMRGFLLAACGELTRVGAPQLAAGRGGDPEVRRHVEQRFEAVVYQPLDALFQEGHRDGLLSAPPELLGEITRGALERLLTSRLPGELNRTAADLLRITVDTVLHGAIREDRP